MKTQAPLRSRKKAKTRQALVEAAMDLFAHKGFESTTVEEIAAAADVSRRTFFRYFPTKDLVLFPHQDAQIDRFRRILGHPAPGETAGETLRRASLDIAALYMEGREEHLRQQNIIRASSYLIARGDRFDEDWEAAIRETLLTSVPDPDEATGRRVGYLAAAMMGIFRAVLRDWYDADCDTDLVAMGREAFSFLEPSVRKYLPSARQNDAH